MALATTAVLLRRGTQFVGTELRSVRAVGGGVLRVKGTLAVQNADEYKRWQGKAGDGVSSAVSGDGCHKRQWRRLVRQA
jgi:hypothetical protein